MTIRMFTRGAFALATVILLATTATAAPVLTNGGFEQNPPNNYGNNINWSISPWVLGGGDMANVVYVDGPGGQTSYENSNSGPGFDATGGAGHYLDIVGSNDLYQEFTPLCTGEVQFGAYFTSRQNNAGTATVTIKDAAGTTDISVPATVTIPGGNSGTDPWTLASFTTNLTANTTYRFHVSMDNNINMDNAFVNFGPDCTEHEPFPHEPDPVPEPLTDAEVQKLCDPITIAGNGDFVLACHLNVQVSEPFPAAITINDSFTVGGATLTSTTSSEPWSCTQSSSGSSLDVDCTLPLADIPPSGASTIDVTMTFPAETPPEGVYNCADGSFEIAGAGPQPIEESCVRIELPEPPEPPALPQCTAFQAEVSCDETIGEPVVTLTSPLGSFTPDDVDISVLTPGITMSTPAGGFPLSVTLGGATAGQTITLLLDAVHTGGGSVPGLDKCCMGEIEVQIPEGFVCEKPPVLEVEKNCQSAGDEIQGLPMCEITVHYEGPPPTSADPIVLDDWVTEGGGVFANISSSDNWQCSQTTMPTSVGCTITDADEPGADWSDWTSTILIPAMSGEGQPLAPGMENCARVSIGGLEAEDCWQNTDAQLEIEKTGPEMCHFGEPCVFTYTITNTSGGDFDGNLWLDDYPDLNWDNGTQGPGSSGSFVSVSPALCTPQELQSGNCNFPLNLPAGQSTTITVSYVLPPHDGEGIFTLENCVSLHADNGSESMDCHTTGIEATQLSVEKTGPEECAPDQPCEFTITISTGDQPFNGNVMLMDGTNVQNFAVTSISPATAGCGSGLPANPLACVVPVNLPANGSITYTIAITPLTPGGQVIADSGENCANIYSLPAGSNIAPGDYSFDSFATPPAFPPEVANVITEGGGMDQACVWFDVPGEDEDEDPQASFDLAIEKQWKTGTDFLNYNPDAGVPPHGYVVEVTIPAGPVPAGTTITVTDPAGGQSGLTPFGPPVAAGAWSCSMSGTSWSCSYTLTGNVAAGVTLPAILWPAINDPAVDSTNCADVAAFAPGASQPLPETDATNNNACVTVPGDGMDPPPVAPEIALEKACDPITVTQPGSQPIPAMHCTITVTALNDFTGGLSIGDSFTALAGGNGAVTSLTTTANGWNCTFTPTPYCTVDNADFGAGDSAQLDVIVTGASDGTDMHWRNCADATWHPDPQSASTLGQSCDDETLETGQRSSEVPAPHLALTKSAGPCTADPADRSYGCKFRIAVENTGNAPFAGPIVLGENFGQPAPVNASTSGEGWACNPADGQGTSCLAPEAALAPGESLSLEITLTIPGLANGGSFRNCASLGVPENERAQAMLIQRIMLEKGIDGGPVDGKPGRKTRAGIRELESRLGMEQTGKITPELFAALGLAPVGEGEQSCVSADLPAMPEALLRCDRATTVARDGECVCRYARMFQRNETACGCVKGTRFVAGKGCVGRGASGSTPKPAVPHESCPKGTRYEKGKGCVKRETRLCPNGRPRIPGLGCVNITIGTGTGGGKRRHD